MLKETISDAETRGVISKDEDARIFDILYALFFFCYRNNPRKKWTAFCILTLCIASPFTFTTQVLLATLLDTS